MKHMEIYQVGMKDLQPGIPGWAKAEGMEMSSSQVSLWRMSAGAHFKTVKDILGHAIETFR